MHALTRMVTTLVVGLFLVLTFSSSVGMAKSKKKSRMAKKPTMTFEQCCEKHDNNTAACNKKVKRSKGKQCPKPTALEDENSSSDMMRDDDEL